LRRFFFACGFPLVIYLSCFTSNGVDKINIKWCNSSIASHTGANDMNTAAAAKQPGEVVSLGTLLKSKRNSLGMTLEEVAHASGLSKSHLHGLENNKHEPGILACAQLSVALGVPVQSMAAAALTHALRLRAALAA
jgi:DNA-binding XRE family transcriptional regulator